MSTAPRVIPRELNGIDLAQLPQSIGPIQAPPALSRFQFALANRWLDGRGVHLMHALAACVTNAIVHHAAARGTAVEKVEATVEGDVDARAFLGLDPSVRNGFEQIRVKLKIKANVIEAQLQ